MIFKKLMLAALSTSLVLLTSCSDEKKEASQTTTLKIATSADYPPFEFFKEGQIIGFDIDVVKAIAERLNKKVEVQDMSFDAILGSLQSNRVDMAISSITPTEERRKAVDFTDEYLSSARVLVCSDTSSVKTLADLSGAVIGVQSGSIHETYANTELRKHTDNIEVKSLAKIPDLLQDLKNKRISCLALGASEAKTMVEQHPGLHLIDLPETASGSAIALPQGSPLTAEVNKVLNELIKDGTIEKLKKKWQVQ
jgi:arginine/lysine/histidine transporter system substrate-binding protein